MTRISDRKPVAGGAGNNGKEQDSNSPTHGRRLEAVVAAFVAISFSALVITAQFAGVARQANNSRTTPARLMLFDSREHSFKGTKMEILRVRTSRWAEADADRLLERCLDEKIEELTAKVALRSEERGDLDDRDCFGLGARSLGSLELLWGSLEGLEVPLGSTSQG